MDSFAVCRVCGIIDEAGVSRWSCKLDSTSSLQAFKLQLLDPAAAPTEEGSKLYQASGWQLPKVSPKLIICQVHLRRGIASKAAPNHNALLMIETILEQYGKGLQRVTAFGDHVHTEEE